MTFQNNFLRRIQRIAQQELTSRDYSIGFYTGGKPLNYWLTVPLDKQEKELNEGRDWYIWYKYRNPETNRLKLFPQVKRGLNRIKTVEGRIKFMKTYRKAIVQVFEEGYNPFFKDETEETQKSISAGAAIDYALQIKKPLLADKSYRDYRGVANDFKEYLKSRGLLNDEIVLISRKTVSEYLVKVLKKTSPRRRNNVRTMLSALYTVLTNEFIIDRNFIKTDIPKLKEKRKTDRRFTSDELRTISDYLKENDPTLLLFLKIVSYNFLRPIEVSRLQVKDIDLKNKELFFDQKTKLGKTKLIPRLYFDELKEMIKGCEHDFHLFTPSRKPAVWSVSDVEKRNYWTKQFRKVKNATGIETDMYGLRHFYISYTYLALRNKGFNQTDAIDSLMRITGHESRDGIEKYIHDYDLEKPEDWSDLIDFKL